MKQPDSNFSHQVAGLTDEIRLLRQVCDEIREELSYANNNAGNFPSDYLPGIRRITSMSVDPTKKDFEVNTVPDTVVDQLRDEATSQRSLF